MLVFYKLRQYLFFGYDLTFEFNIYDFSLREFQKIKFFADLRNMKTKENVSFQIEGRHDPAIIHRARVVVDSMTALVLADMLALRYGTDWLFKEA